MTINQESVTMLDKNLHYLSPEIFQSTAELHPRIHSQNLDLMLGFQIEEIEKDLVSNQSQNYNETWIGLEAQILQTPYGEIFEFLNHFKHNPPTTVVDFGAGYGRVGLVLHSLYPNAQFIGYEVIKQRAKEANRIYQKYNFKNAQVLTQDILSDNFQIPTADIYFIYDFSDPRNIKQILKKLSSHLNENHFAIIARGQGIRSLIQYRFPEFFALTQPVHKKHWSIYLSVVQ
jgi:16S rRNA G527 N7-methylase RsmG